MVTALVYVHDFEIMSGLIVVACLAILNGNFWAAVYIHLQEVQRAYWAPFENDESCKSQWYIQ